MEGSKTVYDVLIGDDFGVAVVVTAAITLEELSHGR